jgi:hypothetical protein
MQREEPLRLPQHTVTPYAVVAKLAQAARRRDLVGMDLLQQISPTMWVIKTGITGHSLWHSPRTAAATIKVCRGEKREFLKNCHTRSDSLDVSAQGMFLLAVRSSR